MVTDTEHAVKALLESQHGSDWFNQRFDERFAKKMDEWATRKTPMLPLIVTRGTLDWAYPPFIMASTAAALGWEVFMSFTFYGLTLLKKELKLETPLGNPAMPMKMPFGPKWFRAIEWQIPNLVMAVIPGFERMATAMMKKTLKGKGVVSIKELRGICIESDVKLIACQMTVGFVWLGPR
jgi:peroxiredoxin family protein